MAALTLASADAGHVVGLQAPPGTPGQSSRPRFAAADHRDGRRQPPHNGGQAQGASSPARRHAAASWPSTTRVACSETSSPSPRRPGYGRHQAQHEPQRDIGGESRTTLWPGQTGPAKPARPAPQYQPGRHARVVSAAPSRAGCGANQFSTQPAMMLEANGGAPVRAANSSAGAQQRQRVQDVVGLAGRDHGLRLCRSAAPMTTAPPRGTTSTHIAHARPRPASAPGGSPHQRTPSSAFGSLRSLSLAAMAGARSWRAAWWPASRCSSWIRTKLAA
jgi:hypothetical protein